jgi:predicted metallopeptidase
MPEYKYAEEVEEIAQKLIKEYHQHLRDAHMCYFFRKPAAKSAGQVVPGRASKVSGKYKAMTGYDFVIEISESHFNEMNENKKKALIDHELSHCYIDLEGNIKTINHDFEGFNGVLRRHGFWAGDLEAMGETAQQLKLPFENKRPELEVVGK